MESEMDLIRADYKNKLMKSIGWEIKAGRKETYSQNKSLIFQKQSNRRYND